MAVYPRIKELRENKGFSQSELAQILNISQSALGNYERGDRIPDADLIKNIAHVFQVSADFLLGLSDCTTAENEGTAKKTGLNESAIKYLEKLAGPDPKTGEILSLIVTNPKFEKLKTVLRSYLSPSDIQRYAGAYIDFAEVSGLIDHEPTKDEAIDFAILSYENLAGETLKEIIRDIRGEKEGALNGNSTETR